LSISLEIGVNGLQSRSVRGLGFLGGNCPFLFIEVGKSTLCNLDMVELETVWHKEDKDVLFDLIQRHLKWTKSKRAEYILDTWSDMVGKFVKVVPIDYRKALEKMRAAEQRHTETTPATEEVF